MPLLGGVLKNTNFSVTFVETPKIYEARKLFNEFQSEITFLKIVAKKQKPT